MPKVPKVLKVPPRSRSLCPVFKGAYLRGTREKVKTSDVGYPESRYARLPVAGYWFNPETRTQDQSFKDDS